MYIIELIVKLLNKKEKKQAAMPQTEYERCEHVFLPIDSTNEILACTKCGFVIHKSDIKENTNNPFKS